MLKRAIIILCSLFVMTIFIPATAAYAVNSADDIAESYKNGDYNKVVDMGVPYLKDDPEDGEISYYVGESLLRQSKPAEAIPYLQKAISKYDEDPQFYAHAYYMMGLCQYYTGNNAEAVKALDVCVQENWNTEIAKNASSLLKMLNLSFYFNNWTISETDHFIFHFHPSITKAQIDEHSKNYEASYARINNSLPILPIKKLDDYVWDSEKTLKQQKADSSYTSGFSNYPDFFMMDSDLSMRPENQLAVLLSYWASPPADLLNTMDKLQAVPFINEGTISYLKNNGLSGNVYIKWKTLLAVQNGFLPEPPIEVMWKDETLSYYSYGTMQDISGAFVDFLISKAGTEKYRLLLEDPTYTNAQSIYGEQLSTIINDFEGRYRPNYLVVIVSVLVLLFILVRNIISRRRRNRVVV